MKNKRVLLVSLAIAVAIGLLLTGNIRAADQGPKRDPDRCQCTPYRYARGLR